LTAGELREAAARDAGQNVLQRECERLGIVTRDPAMLALFRDLEKAARSSLPILIAGEPGTGKELFARAAHRLSPRADGRSFAVNMGAIPAELFESEMFGHGPRQLHRRGRRSEGTLRASEPGTIFLDEVGELRPEHQSKLLRVLQDKSFYRVGAPRRDHRRRPGGRRQQSRPRAGQRRGWFREDLYFRLKGLVLRLPPLARAAGGCFRSPGGALRPRAASEVSRPALPLSDAALAALERNDWPGNARELQNCLRQALALADGNAITVADLRLAAREPSSEDSGGDEAVWPHSASTDSTCRPPPGPLGWDRSTVTQRLKGLGFRALVDAGGDRTKAALALAGEPLSPGRSSSSFGNTPSTC